MFDLMSTEQQPPLMGFYWNEAEGDDILNRGLLSIFAHDLSGHPHAIGTGFVVRRADSNAVCITAAHVFSEVRRLQSPPPRHSLSTLPEFLPPPKELDLDRELLRAVFKEGGRIEVAIVEGVIFDTTTDIALFSVSLQTPDTEPFFSGEFFPDSSPPAVGELVCVLSYGDQGILDYEHHGGETYSFKMERRPILRVGRVLAHYPDGHRLCRGPCIETSIPVYSGMSGGPAFRFGTDGPMRPFGLVCSDPDLDGEKKQNRSIEGRSIFAVLPCRASIGDDGKENIVLALQSNDAAGQFKTVK